jgi:hypothetical protein
VTIPASCHPDRPAHSRYLCRNCYETAYKRGTHLEHPRQTRRRADVIEDYTMLRSEGYTRAQIAERIGMHPKALEGVYFRAIRAGELTPDRERAA